MSNKNVRDAWPFRFRYQGSEPEVVQKQRAWIDGNFSVARLNEIRVVEIVRNFHRLPLRLQMREHLRINTCCTQKTTPHRTRYAGR